MLSAKCRSLCRPTCSSTHHRQKTRAAIYEAVGGVESDQQLSQLIREQRDILRQAENDKQAAELKAKRQKDARDRANRLKKRHGMRENRSSGSAQIDRLLEADPQTTKPWACASCTFVNEPGISVCGMCKTPQGQIWEFARDSAGVPFCRAPAGADDITASQNAGVDHVAPNPMSPSISCRPNQPCRP